MMGGLIEQEVSFALSHRLLLTIETPMKVAYVVFLLPLSLVKYISHICSILTRFILKFKML